MQVNLVFPPFTVPSVPLGIAHLKSYIEENSNFKVKCFDLNAEYLSMLYDNIDALCSTIGNNGDGTRRQPGAKEIRESMDVLKGVNAGFFDQSTYNHAAEVFTTYFKSVSDAFLANCGRSIKGEQAPPDIISEYADLLLENSPDVVGFSVMFPEQLGCSILLARALRKSGKELKIVFGGATGSTVPDFPVIDFVVTNEGEEALLALVTALNEGNGLDSVPNLLPGRKYGHACAGQQSPTSMLTKLDKIPFPDFSDFNLESGYLSPSTVIPILGSRGCYWRKCAFCVHHKTYSEKYRVASIKHVIDEIEQHVDKGFRYFSFVDEMIPPKRFRLLSAEIRKRNLDITYYALAQPTDRFSREILEDMYDSGCRYILWGVESGSQRVLDLIDKGTTVETVSRVLTESAAAGIKNHAFIIIGFPTETIEELQDTLNFLYNHQDSIHQIHKGAFSLHQGSGVYKNPDKFNITKISEPGRAIGDVPCGFEVSSGISPEDAQKYLGYLNKGYFNDFSYFSGWLTVLRDHGLVLYSNPDKLVFNMGRRSVRSPADINFQFSA
ncbi:MAG: B12-binding domain-containing radical SAM protein [Thiogranum sp.]